MHLDFNSSIHVGVVPNTISSTHGIAGGPGPGLDAVKSFKEAHEVRFQFPQHTVDGRNPIPNHLGCFLNLVNNGINYQDQLVSRISSINSMMVYWYTVLLLEFLE